MTDVDADAVAGMVRACAPEWELRGYERAEEGTDFVAVVDCATPDGDRTAVLKATTAGFVRPEIARSEPRLLALVGRETSIPVPEVYGFADDHDEYPAPFYLMAYAPGENYEDDPSALPDAARERVVREAGGNLADLHAVGELPRVGRVGVRDGDLAVLDYDDGPADDFRAHFARGVEETCDALADGTYFPDRADEPDRFADLADPLRAALRERADALREPEPPRYCHWDYRYGNLLVDPDTGETRAVLDWANLTAAEPAYNLAKVESHLFDAQADGPERAADLRALFRESYAAARDGWTFTPAVESRMETYLLKCRAEAMACLPLWLEDATAEEKDERERQHRDAVADAL
ncbi:phosphotransferase family protein [Halosegnis marinus]|uniref:Phosphotransferase family protein n=1 Tax=Halosegnis marinus TaxID=3034023 RepID=A0ABD5ZNC6_9EURY|nr:phosphotransferase [Halosegnis sp. DT85]